MTLDERRELVREMLLEGDTDRSIALAVGCSRELVAKIRRTLPDVPTKRRALDGKLYDIKPRTSPAGQKVGTLYHRTYQVLRDLRAMEHDAVFAAAPRSVRSSLGALALELAATVARLRKASEQHDAANHMARREAMGLKTG